MAGLTARPPVSRDGTPAGWQTRRPLLPELALVTATVAYGATFVLVQDALERVTSVGFIVLRFGLGALVLAPIALRRGWRRPHVDASARSFVRAGIALGAIAFVGYWFQNTGLERTTTSNSAFITGLFVVFTPLVETVATRRPPSRNVVLAVIVSAIGLFLMTGADFSMNAGDALTLGCAASFGVWIYLGGQFSPRFDPITLTALQLTVLTLCALPFAAIQGFGTIDTQVVVAVAVTGVLCSALGFTLQLWAQGYIAPSRAAVILLCEQVVAGIVGYFVGERLGVAGYIGALVILAGIVLAESRSWRQASTETTGLAGGLSPSEP